MSEKTRWCPLCEIKITPSSENEVRKHFIQAHGRIPTDGEINQSLNFDDWDMELKAFVKELPKRQAKRQEENQARRRKKGLKPIPSPGDTPLKFSLMGGAGEIRCLECGYTKSIVSFIHGFNSCTAGYQCQSCGELVKLDDRTEGRIEGGCNCGGVLSRQKAIFCPQCKSMRIDYWMPYIT